MGFFLYHWESKSYRLQNKLNTVQHGRESLELNNKNLKQVKDQRHKEISLISEEISQKDKEIAKNEAILKELESNIKQITQTAIKH